LSVWVNAEKFLPKEGEVVWLRGLRNHAWANGSLNAWEGDCGSDWWVAGKQVEAIEAGRRLMAWWEERGRVW
jgi:hypothetical protein